jgi:hypothetical protein
MSSNHQENGRPLWRALRNSSNKPLVEIPPRVNAGQFVGNGQRFGLTEPFRVSQRQRNQVRPNGRQPQIVDMKRMRRLFGFQRNPPQKAFPAFHGKANKKPGFPRGGRRPAIGQKARLAPLKHFHAPLVRWGLERRVSGKDGVLTWTWGTWCPIPPGRVEAVRPGDMAPPSRP